LSVDSTIKEKLEGIEQKFDVKILFACELGKKRHLIAKKKPPAGSFSLSQFTPQ